MEHERLVPNKSINETIYRCFEYISSEDQQKFLKKFRGQHRKDPELTHTFRELVLGAYLSWNGFLTKYEYELDTLTPDWCLFNENSKVIGIIELVNLHPDFYTEDKLNKGSLAWAKDNSARFYERVKNKVITYKDLVSKHDISYIVAVFLQMGAEFNYAEFEKNLYDEEIGLFHIYPALNGIIIFQEGLGNPEFLGHYNFQFRASPIHSEGFSIGGIEFKV
jgi:hypothetical protein